MNRFCFVSEKIIPHNKYFILYMIYHNITMSNNCMMMMIAPNSRARKGGR